MLGCTVRRCQNKYHCCIGYIAVFMLFFHMSFYRHKAVFYWSITMIGQIWLSSLKNTFIGATILYYWCYHSMSQLEGKHSRLILSKAERMNKCSLQVFWVRHSMGDNGALKGNHWLAGQDCILNSGMNRDMFWKRKKCLTWDRSGGDVRCTSDGFSRGMTYIALWIPSNRVTGRLHSQWSCTKPL